MMTNKEFCDQLREVAHAIGKGDQEIVSMPRSYIEINLGTEANKINTAYMRSIMQREMKKYGMTISISTSKNEDGFTVYTFAAKDGVKKRTFTSDELPQLELKWKAKLIKQLLMQQPRITDLQGDQLTGAAIALERFAQMLKDMCDDE